MNHVNRTPVKMLVGIVVSVIAFASAQEPPTSDVRRTTSPRAKLKASPQGKDEITREQAEAILAELRAIHELLQKQGSQDRFLFVPADQPNSNQSRDAIQLDVGHNWHSLGREDAPVALLEFTDYQCPFCRAFHAETFPHIKKEFIDAGRVRYINLDLPLPQHPEASTAAEAARCAGDQNKYWEFRSAILSDQRSPSQDVILETARSLSLDIEGLQRCLSSHAHKVEMEEDLADAAFLQINGTPTFLLGKMWQGRVQGTLIRGVMPYPTLQAKIEKILRGSRP